MRRATITLPTIEAAILAAVSRTSNDFRRSNGSSPSTIERCSATSMGSPPD